MIAPAEFVALLQKQGLQFYCGVPDSLLKNLCTCIDDVFTSDSHVITANEGGAIGLATGYHLATGKACVVYMQNSGIGNAINPLVSLADPEVYSIPVFVIVGWRGEPGTQDEPQHKKQGRIQEKLLDALEYPHQVLSSNVAVADAQVTALCSQMHRDQTPVILCVKENTFEKHTKPNNDVDEAQEELSAEMSREEAIDTIVDHVPDNCRIVSTTGKASRELFELRQKKKHAHHHDFLTVGSMGHAGMIALGIANSQARPVVCIEGDGAMLMHMGAMGILAQHLRGSFVHIVLNNGVHDSVGAQPTIGRKISFSGIAGECGYNQTHGVATKAELMHALSKAFLGEGSVFIEVIVRKGARSSLGRPSLSPVENKRSFMKEFKNGR